MDDKTDPKKYKLLKVASAVFDENGGLVTYTAQQWNKQWVSLADRQRPPSESPSDDFAQITDDDVPF